MSKTVHILGCNGNMGSRYRAILNSLGVLNTGYDVYPEASVNTLAADAYIVATPTANHLTDLDNLLQLGKPILCEKPLTTDYSLLETFCDRHKDRLHLVTLVDQYKYMFIEDDSDEEGLTFYNYFKSGKDGLAWDCLNIAGKAKDGVILKNESPVWECSINGKSLNIKHMDSAYVSMVEDWLKNPTSNMLYAISAHRKVKEYLECHRY